MKITCKKTNKDITSKVINQIENTWKNEGVKVISKSPYRYENGKFNDYKMWSAFHSGEITM